MTKVGKRRKERGQLSVSIIDPSLFPRSQKSLNGKETKPKRKAKTHLLALSLSLPLGLSEIQELVRFERLGQDLTQQEQRVVEAGEVVNRLGLVLGEGLDVLGHKFARLCERVREVEERLGDLPEVNPTG